MVVEQAVQADERDPRSRGRDIVRVGRVVEEHHEPGVARPHRLLVADRERRAAVPHTTPSSLSSPFPLARGATALPRCSERARGHRSIRHRGDRVQRSPADRPPTSSPSTSSARLQAAPGRIAPSPGHGGAQRFRVPRWAVVAYFASVASSCEPPALRRAEALVLRDGQEVARAAVAPARPEGARDSDAATRRPVPSTGRADRLITVNRVEPERAAPTCLQHDGSAQHRGFRFVRLEQAATGRRAERWGTTSRRPFSK